MISVVSMIITLFILMDSIGNIPIFIAYLHHFKPRRQLRIIVREMLCALVLMVAFVFCGKFLLSFLHVTQSTVEIAGGIILFLIALKLVFPAVHDRHRFTEEAHAVEEPFLVPLTVPLTMGPAVLATIMLYANLPGRTLDLLFSVIVAWILSTCVLLLAPLAQKLFGKKVLKAAEILIGLILVLMAVQMFSQGVRAFINSYA